MRETNVFGAWTALVIDPEFDDNSASISATLGSFEIVIPLNYEGRFVSAYVYDRAIDGMPAEFVPLANGTRVSPWSRPAVMCVLEAAAAVVIAAALKTPCENCGRIGEGNTCCYDPTMADLLLALDHIAIGLGWWGEQLPASPFSDVMTKRDHDRHVMNNRAACLDERDLVAADLVAVKAR